MDEGVAVVVGVSSMDEGMARGTSVPWMRAAWMRRTLVSQTVRASVSRMRVASQKRVVAWMRHERV